jgi:hypothetical protein
MNLKQYIKTHWQSDENAAADLGVSLRTIKNWTSVNPSGILKHTGQIIHRVNAFELLELFDAVAQSMEQINEQRAKA